MAAGHAVLITTLVEEGTIPIEWVYRYPQVRDWASERTDGVGQVTKALVCSLAEREWPDAPWPRSPKSRQILDHAADAAVTAAVAAETSELFKALRRQGR